MPLAILSEGRHRKRLQLLAGEAHAGAAIDRLTVAQENDACGFEGRLHLFHTTQPGILPILESIDRVHADAGALGEPLSAPLKGSSGHAALFWLHVVKISPNVVDIKQVMLLPLMV